MTCDEALNPSWKKKEKTVVFRPSKNIKKSSRSQVGINVASIHSSLEDKQEPDRRLFESIPTQLLKQFSFNSITISCVVIL